MLAPALFYTRPTPTQEEPDYVVWLRQLDKANLERLEACINALKELEQRQALSTSPPAPQLSAPQ